MPVSGTGLRIFRVRSGATGADVKITKGGEDVTDRILPAIARNLREFGYPDVTPETVRESLSKPDEDIIAMFAKGMLEENGLELRQ